MRRWVQSLRESAEPALRNAAILIRPHPARMDEWRDVDLSAFEHVSLYGSNPVDDASKDDYFESLFYSAAVVGLNTSAFLEGRHRRPARAHGAAAGVPGEPGRRAALPLSAARRRRRAAGGPHVSRSTTRSWRRRSSGRRTSRAPGSCATSCGLAGLDVAATPVFCDAIEDLLRQPAPAPVARPVRFVAAAMADGAGVPGASRDLRIRGLPRRLEPQGTRTGATPRNDRAGQGRAPAARGSARSRPRRRAAPGSRRSAKPHCAPVRSPVSMRRHRRRSSSDPSSRRRRPVSGRSGAPGCAPA